MSNVSANGEIALVEVAYLMSEVLKNGREEGSVSESPTKEKSKKEPKKESKDKKKTQKDLDEEEEGVLKKQKSKH